MEPLSSYKLLHTNKKKKKRKSRPRWLGEAAKTAVKAIQRLRQLSVQGRYMGDVHAERPRGLQSITILTISHNHAAFSVSNGAMNTIFVAKPNRK